MGDEWDLHAVVRSCSGVKSAAVATSTTTVDQIEDTFLNLASLDSSENDYSPFIYTDFSDNQSCKWDGLLEDIYKDSCAPPHPIPTTTLIPILEGIQNLPPPPPLIDSQNGSLPFPATTSRSRKRKTQPKKTVMEMTQEELTGDLWAWRKYGQKPIKGSPYPRNYYRCSTSKVCGARKQVERSHTDPSIFVVSYTGDHSHPRPTHRSSLAGSSRAKFQASLDKPLPAAPVVSKPSFSSSSPASVSSFSPTTPLVEDEIGLLDDDILIPNVIMTEDIFKGFQELNGGGVVGFGGGGATRNLLSPPWYPTMSATTSFTDGGGAC